MAWVNHGGIKRWDWTKGHPDDEWEWEQRGGNPKRPAGRPKKEEISARRAEVVRLTRLGFDSRRVSYRLNITRKMVERDIQTAREKGEM